MFIYMYIQNPISNRPANKISFGTCRSKFSFSCFHLELKVRNLIIIRNEGGGSSPDKAVKYIPVCDHLMAGVKKMEGLSGVLVSRFA